MFGYLYNNIHKFICSLRDVKLKTPRNKLSVLYSNKYNNYIYVKNNQIKFYNKCRYY